MPFTSRARTQHSSKLARCSVRFASATSSSSMLFPDTRRGVRTTRNLHFLSFCFDVYAYFHNFFLSSSSSSERRRRLVSSILCRRWCRFVSSNTELMSLILCSSSTTNDIAQRTHVKQELYHQHHINRRTHTRAQERASEREQPASTPKAIKTWLTLRFFFCFVSLFVCGSRSISKMSVARIDDEDDNTMMIIAWWRMAARCCFSVLLLFLSFFFAFLRAYVFKLAFLSRASVSSSPSHLIGSMNAYMFSIITCHTSKIQCAVRDNVYLHPSERIIFSIWSV